MKPEFREELYYWEIINRRKEIYLGKAKEIADSCDISTLSNNQIKGLENTVFTAREMKPILNYLLNILKKSKQGHDWAMVCEEEALAETILYFINNEVCTDGEGMKSIKEDMLSISESDLKKLIEDTQIRLTREFIKYLSGWYSIKIME